MNHVLNFLLLSLGLLFATPAQAGFTDHYRTNPGEVRSVSFYVDCVHRRNSDRALNYLVGYIDRVQNRRLFLQFGEKYTDCTTVNGGASPRDFFIGGFLAEHFLPAEIDMKAVSENLKSDFPKRLQSEQETILCSIESNPTGIAKMFTFKWESRTERKFIKSLGETISECLDSSDSKAFSSIRYQPIVRSYFAMAIFAGLGDKIRSTENNDA